jgi:dolichyl-phosphate-mannose--protein O-mannosyl transferase
VLGVFVLGALLHFVRLGTPAEVIFDEVHFGKFVTAYCCGHERQFDIHPPHAKLLTAGMARLLGYEGQVSFEKIGLPLAGAAWRLRFFAALVGTLLPLLMYRVARQLGASQAAAWLAMVCVVLDNGVLVQTRVIALDGLLMLATLGAVSGALSAVRDSMRLRTSTAWAMAAGVCAGLAVGTKFLGGAAGLVAVAVLLRGRKFGQVVLFGLAAVAVYLAGWWLHFRLMTLPGPGDAFLVPTGHFWPDLVAMHREMIGANSHLSGGHSYASSMWSWPMMARGVFYWSEDDRAIYFLGNPAVWWGASLLGLVAIVNLGLMRASRLQVEDGAARQRLWIPLLGLAVSYLPFLAIGRIMFMYHFLVPLLFVVLVTVLFLDRIGWTNEGAMLAQRRSYFGALALVVTGFLCLAPFTFGWPVMESWGKVVFGLFPGWR